MTMTDILGRKPFWVGIFSVLLGGGGLCLGRSLDIGTLGAPGPGAFPLALSLVVLLFGAILLLRAAAPPSDERLPPRTLLRSPVALAGSGLALAAAALAFLGPLSPYFARFGPAPLFWWYVLVLTLGAVAACLAGSPARALGAALIGLLLGMSSLDPLLTTVERYASVEQGIWLNVFHGLILAMVAYHIGLNALLIALALALATLVAAIVAAVAAAVWLRRTQAPVRAETSPTVAPIYSRPAFWGGAAALLAGAAGLYFGANIGTRAPGDLGGFGPGAAPMALSGAPVLLGAAALASALRRPADAATHARLRRRPSARSRSS